VALVGMWMAGGLRLHGQCNVQKCFPSVILRLSWNASVYGMWKERNNRVRGNGSRSAEFVVNLDCTAF